MIVTPGLDELLAAPGGRYLVRPQSVSFIAAPELVGVMVWGRLDAEGLLALLRDHERMRPVLATRTAAIADVRHLELPDPSAFAAMVGFLAERRDWLAEYIDRFALVRRDIGLVGAAAAGFFDVSTRPFVVETFTDLGGALAWARYPDAVALEMELEEILADASGAPPMLVQLRAQLEARPGALSLPQAAKALGVTERSLQRWLKSWDTTFKAEQNRAQVQVAQQLLARSDAPLAQVASQVGCASLSHFSALFRRLTGATPSHWRRDHRG